MVSSMRDSASWRSKAHKRSPLTLRYTAGRARAPWPMTGVLLIFALFSVPLSFLNVVIAIAVTSLP
jgi:hypothetical protein